MKFIEMTGKSLKHLISRDELHLNNLEDSGVEDDTIVRVNQQGDIEIRRRDRWDVIGGLLGQFEERMKEETGLDWDRRLIGHGDGSGKELSSPLCVARSVADQQPAPFGGNGKGHISVAVDEFAGHGFTEGESSGIGEKGRRGKGNQRDGLDVSV